MAELAAGVVGFVAFGPQVLKSCLELKSIWSTIKDAPTDVSDLVDELSQLSAILEILRQQHEAFCRFSPASSTWEAPLQRCADVAVDLEAVAFDLKNRLQKSKTVGSVTKIFKKDAIAKHRER
jgi:hypothetical protein